MKGIYYFGVLFSFCIIMDHYEGVKRCCYYSYFLYFVIASHNKMASSDSTSRESAHTKNAITNELENNEESTQLNRSENMSCGANKRISKNFPPVEPFHHAYHVGKVLGKGGFGVVYEGTRIRDGLQVALKHISKSKITEYGQVSNYHLPFYSTYICIIK